MSESQPTIVVGVSAATGSPVALRWAAEQARTTGARVVAVRAWRMPAPQATPSGTSAGRVGVRPDEETQARRQLEQDVRAVLGDDAEVECRLVVGGKRKVLLHESRGAQMLVIDAPRALTTGPMLAHRLVYAAECPVVVMPPQVAGAPESALRKASRAVGRQALRGVGTAGHPGAAYRRTIDE